MKNLANSHETTKEKRESVYFLRLEQQQQLFYKLKKGRHVVYLLLKTTAKIASFQTTSCSTVYEKSDNIIETKNNMPFCTRQHKKGC